MEVDADAISYIVPRVPEVAQIFALPTVEGVGAKQKVALKGQKDLHFIASPTGEERDVKWTDAPRRIKVGVSAKHTEVENDALLSSTPVTDVQK
mmetsp:Transcript_7772/g.8919  ORF Transcript_7772/g.8919 Transcript_7772/m.8919 type:complete len:94 (+) Transcript_7772:863-1144(+)